MGRAKGGDELGDTIRMLAGPAIIKKGKHKSHSIRSCRRRERCTFASSCDEEDDYYYNDDEGIFDPAELSFPRGFIIVFCSEKAALHVQHVESSALIFHK